MRARSLTALLTPAVLLLGLAWLASPAFAGAQKTTLCHVPPGNPENAHEIVVSEKAIEAHLGNHPGDQVGTCQQGCAFADDCSDGDFCTQDVCNPDGSCDNSAPVDCDDGDVCTMDGCDPLTGCGHLPEPDDPQILCDDLNACTETDMCVAGVCAGTAMQGCCASDADCLASDACATRYCEDATGTCQEVDLSSQCTAGACEVAFCDPVTGCRTEDVTCPDDGDICTVATCNPNICSPVGLCETMTNPSPAEESPDAGTCNDGLDNDCDGFTDVNDPDCCIEDTTLIFDGIEFAGQDDRDGAFFGCASELSGSGENCTLFICFEEFDSGGACSECVEFGVECALCKQALTNNAVALGCDFVFTDCPAP